MDGSSFTTLGETPCADPHAGCCGDWRLETSGYPIMHFEWEYEFAQPASFFRSSFACLSSLFSRSSCLILSAASEVTPGLLPESTSIRLTQALNVSGVQPIFDEIDTSAAHRDGGSCSEVKTMQTARSRTSADSEKAHMGYVRFLSDFQNL